MPPNSSKPYPFSRGLSQYSQNNPLSLNETSTLAILKKQPVEDNLRKVVRSVRGPLEFFAKTALHATFDVAIECNGVVERRHWELMVQKARRSLHSVLDALGVLHLSLFHSKTLMKTVEQILDDNQKEFGEDMQKLQELRTHLRNLNKFLECVLLRYSNLSCNLPRTLVEDIKRTAKKIHKVMMQLKSNKLEALVPDCVITEEDGLCSVLGLCDEFAERLKNLNEEMRQHQTEMYFLLCFMKERYESFNVEDLSDTVKCLQKIGFTENRSSVIAEWIAKQPFPEHRSLLAWAEIYIENLFKYDIFLNDNVSNFPYKEHCINKWFDVDVPVESDTEVDEGGDACIQVPVINVTAEDAAAGNIQKKIDEFKQKHPEEKLYFHGTDHKSAEDILENGINLGEGAKFCDFSHGYGFYVADKHQYALNWTKKHTARAVILYNIKDDCLKEGDCLDLSDTRRRKDFISVTEYFRAGAPRRKSELRPALLKEVQNCKYIIGPISKDDTKSNQWQDVLQICIKDVDMAGEIGSPSNVVGIVFLNMEASQLARRS